MLSKAISHFKDTWWNSFLIWNDMIPRICFKIIEGVVSKSILKQVCHKLIVVESGWWNGYFEFKILLPLFVIMFAIWIKISFNKIYKNK